MIIAIDYDRTYSADPDLWKQFIGAAKGRGHDVVMITARAHVSDDVFADVWKAGVVMIIATGLKAKRKHAEKMGIKVDIWIDDNPGSIDG